MPLLMSSRMTSAGLTDSRSARSLTVIVAGSSAAPRSRGSATWTATPPKGSRRWGLRGPRRPRVPLLLLANEASWGGGCDRRQQLRGDGRGDGTGQGTRQEASLRRLADAARVTADIGAAAGRPTGRVEGD